MKIINDRPRELFKNAIYNRATRGKSSIILADYGRGKTTLLEHINIREKRLRKLKVESLSPVHYILTDILNQMDVKCAPKPHLNMHHLRLIQREVPGKGMVIIDECNDLKPEVWPYIKRIIDAGVPVVLAGLPQVRYFLRERHGDILSRLKVIDLDSVGVDDFKRELVKFDPDAIDVIYGAAGGNMRKMEEIIDDCLDKATETKTEKIGIDIVAMFV